MASQHRHYYSGDDLQQAVRDLVRLIAETEFADPVDAGVMQERRLYRACLDWRLEALAERSLFGQPDNRTTAGTGHQPRRRDPGLPHVGPTLPRNAARHH